MTVKVFYTNTNKTLREISTYMKDNNIEHNLQNIETNPPTWEEFLSMIDLSESGLDRLMPTVKSKAAMKILRMIDMDAITLKEYYKMIVENPILIRTPIVMDHKNIMIGLQKDEISMFHSREDKRNRFNQLLESVRLNEKYQLEEELGYSLA